jgi:hypothetical protein
MLGRLERNWIICTLLVGIQNRTAVTEQFGHYAVTVRPNNYIWGIYHREITLRFMQNIETNVCNSFICKS